MSNFTNNPWTDNPWRKTNKLLATGQTTSYHDDDDGDLEKGIAHDFTVLNAGQYSGTTNIVINGKTCALSNNCVKDNNTGLIWARYVPQTGIGSGADGKLFWDEWELASKTTISFDAASKEIRDSASGFVTAALPAGRKFASTGSVSNNTEFTVVSSTTSVIVVSEVVVNEAAGATVTITTVEDLVWNFVDQANANSLGGYNDWRMPNITELQSIANRGELNPSIDTSSFPSTPNSSHWTSTTRPGFSAHAFFVNFNYALASYSYKAQVVYYTRLLRG